MKLELTNQTTEQHAGQCGGLHSAGQPTKHSTHTGDGRNRGQNTVAPGGLETVSTGSGARPVTGDDVLRAQQRWGRAVVRVGALRENRAACVAAGAQLVDELYDTGNLLFKPTVVRVQYERCITPAAPRACA